MNVVHGVELEPGIDDIVAETEGGFLAETVVPRQLAQEVADAGATFLDAPLGRTPQHAYDGLLNIMCAGDKAAFDRVEPVLKDLGENVFHLGASGAGHTIKLLNNFFGMTVANAMAEVMAVSDHAGVDRKLAHQVIAAGPLHSMMMDFVAAYGIEGDASKLAFSIQNASKDLGYYRQMTRDVGVESVMAVPAAEAMADASGTMGERMVSEMVDYYAQRFKA
jgi:2-hydroxy-3-oxopropionate reductase